MKRQWLFLLVAAGTLALWTDAALAACAGPCQHLGDYAEDYATLNFKFTTRTAACVPTTLAGTPAVKVYVGSATDTEINTGVTLVADFDGVTGLNNVLIDLSAAAFYATGQDYAVVITTGTVDGVSVVGEVVATFSIENRFNGAADALAATNLDHLTGDIGAGLDTVIHDTSILGFMLASSDVSTYARTTDSHEAIANAVGAAVGALYVPDAASTITTGNEDAGTWASCAADNDTRWTIGDEDGANTIDVTCEFNMGASRVAAQLDVNGYFNRLGGGGYVVEVYAWDYTGAAWLKISGGTTDTQLADRSSDKDYVFAIPSNCTDTVTTAGEVKIQFRSTRATTAGGDVLYLDYVAVIGLASAALSPEANASAVWQHDYGHAVALHTLRYTGHVWYVDAGMSDDEGSGTHPHDAFQKIGTAITAASAGDRINVKAGSYAEASIDITKDGLELWGEHGTILTGGGSGTALEISASNVLVNGVWATPGAGQVGFDIGPDATCHRTRLVNCISYSTGGTGFRVGTDDGRATFEHCEARGYTTAGFNLGGPAPYLTDCQAIAPTSTSSIGYHLSNAACDRGMLYRCRSINNGTSSLTIVSGADENIIHLSADSDTCGAVVDGGTNNALRDMLDVDNEWARTTRTLTGTQVFDLTGDITGSLSGSVGSVTNEVTADMTKISGDSTAADNLEEFLNGTDGAGVILRAEQLKLACNVDSEAALDCRNAHANGIGQYNSGLVAGQYNSGDIGQYNSGGTNIGQLNDGAGYGQRNTGVLGGQRNDGAKGQWNQGLEAQKNEGTGDTPIALTLVGTADRIDDILADTDELQTDWVNGGRLDLLLDLTLADTDALQTWWVDGGRLDLILDASSLGAGSTTYVYTVTSSVAPNPVIANVLVWVTTDVAGDTVVASGYTSTLGVVTFYLDPGTYHFWRSKAGYTFVNPDTEVVP